MTATTALRAYTTGFCAARQPESSHRRCPGAPLCACTCHATCPTCGQHLPAAAHTVGGAA